MTLSDAERSALIEAVRTAARDHVLPRFRALSPADIASKAAADDLVTAADLAAEAYLTEAVARIFPGALVVGEEAAAADPALPSRIADADVTVIIDPIDGTWNYANGLSVFGMILSVVRDGETVFGLHYDPLNDDWVEAGLGAGAWLHHNGRHRLRLTPRSPRPAAQLFGMIPIWLFEPGRRPAIFEAERRLARVSSLRCSCHEYRLLAQSSVDFLLSATAKSWDHAAGVLIATEAGGATRMLDGGAYLPGLSQGSLLAARDESTLETVQAMIAEIGGTIEIR
ncbi:inositol monophosphatase [Paracoccus sp. S1E-3]|uniref:inositol monophosphatase family protein n=1 Tax=Paracoccus sp. S1E-3 TaxID=2756130 RepID=UPI0015EFD0D1|nr:inositol monophosphatase [Paracoccus sp. S1E-3]MBA4489372.1 inositol monophosphatase [Paracoccus sp. S1E-3]